MWSLLPSSLAATISDRANCLSMLSTPDTGSGYIASRSGHSLAMTPMHLTVQAASYALAGSSLAALSASDRSPADHAAAATEPSSASGTAQ